MRDRIVEKILAGETRRQQNTLSLIPSENHTSQAVRAALSSVFTDKYAEGYPHHRYYQGQAFAGQLEDLTIARAKAVFKAKFANVQPYSGSPANMAVYQALLAPGDTILGLSLPFGGHLSHGWKVNFTARFYKTVAYELSLNNRLDYTAILALAKKTKPKIIVAGATAYPRAIDFKKFAAIAKAVNAYLLADISHIAGLVVGKVHQNPLPHADVVMTTTHKTLRGPRGAIILSNDAEIAKKIDRAVFPGLQGGPHLNTMAGIAIALQEAAQSSFARYARQIVVNAATLAMALQKEGLQLVAGGTDNHLLLINLSASQDFAHLSGTQAAEVLESVGIVVNKNMVPRDTRSPFDPSGIRLGTPAITTRGMKQKEMKQLAALIVATLRNTENTKELQRIRRTVTALTKKFPLPR